MDFQTLIRSWGKCELPKEKKLSDHHRLNLIEERMNILLLENAKLKLLIEDLCHEVSTGKTLKPKTRKQS